MNLMLIWQVHVLEFEASGDLSLSNECAMKRLQEQADSFLAQRLTESDILQEESVDQGEEVSQASVKGSASSHRSKSAKKKKRRKRSRREDYDEGDDDDDDNDLGGWESDDALAYSDEEVSQYRSLYRQFMRSLKWQ